MKNTYKFIKDLMALLRSDDWQQDLNKRTALITQELATLEERCDQELEVMKENWRLLEAKGKKSPSTIKQQELLAKKVNSYEQIREGFLKETSDIEQCLKAGQYKIGIGVFQSIEDVALLLSNIHLLYSKKLTASFNEQSLAAVRKMLQVNFEKLYTKEVDLSFNHLIDYSVDYSVKETQVEKFLASKINSNSPVQDFVPYYNEASAAIRKLIENYFNLIINLDTKLVAHIYKQLNPLMSIHFGGGCSRQEFDPIIFTIGTYFSSTEDIDSYLEKEVDFTSWETMENSIMIVGNNLDISKLSPTERQIWQELNAKFAKKSIKLFGQANDLQKILNLSVTKIISEYAAEKEFSSLDILFQIIQNGAEQIRFEREEENAKLAQLSRKYNIDEVTFNRILDTILPSIKDTDLLPEVQLKLGEQDKYTFKKLPAGDLQGLFLGKMTACCQFITGDAEKCVIDGFTRPDAGFYVLISKKNSIKAQSYAWIGQNNEGEDVLVLDSFEYLPGFEKYFVDLVKQLSNAIKAHGFKELYVGTGGKTPRLEYSQKYKIVEKYPQLFRYQDSESLYKIDANPKLQEIDTALTRIPKYKTFSELVEYNPYLSYEQIKERDKSGELQELNEVSQRAIAMNSIILNKLLSDSSITITQLAKLFTIVDDSDCTRVTVFHQRFEDTVERWKTVLKYSVNNYVYQDFIYNLDNVHKVNSVILELLGNQMPLKALILIEEYRSEPIVTYSDYRYSNLPIVEGLGDIMPEHVSSLIHD